EGRSRTRDDRYCATGGAPGGTRIGVAGCADRGGAGTGRRAGRTDLRERTTRGTRGTKGHRRRCRSRRTATVATRRRGTDPHRADERFRGGAACLRREAFAALDRDVTM